MVHSERMKKFRSIGKRLMPFLIISLCFIVLGSLALKPGKEFQVDTYKKDGQYDPVIAMDKKGNFVITWASEGKDGSGYGISAQRFNKQGKALGKEFQVNSSTEKNQGIPDIAMDPKGNFVITWGSSAEEGFFAGDIYAQRFNKKGKALGKEFRVNTCTNDVQMRPAIAMDKSGNFVITWDSNFQDSSNQGIFAQRYSKKGIVLGSEFQVNTTTWALQMIPDIAMDPKGNFAIVWEASEQEGMAMDVFAQVFTKYGQANGPEFRVNTHTVDYQVKPAICMDKKGNFIITWESYDQDEQYTYGVYAQRFNKTGKALGKEFRVNTFTDSQQNYSAIAINTKGIFVITWVSSRQHGYTTGIYAQKFNKSGKTLGSEIQVSTLIKFDQWRPAVAIDGKGNFVITWDSRDQDGTKSGIFAKMFKK
ncbi:MAG: hypothetical protein GQ544_09505 [Candidatus Aminicenantes bacterium]|nr:hypothetical protein [Candidatus Aminicenantes bacterium]